MNIKGILREDFIRNVLKLSASSTLLTFVPIIVTPILSRLYSPEDYAEWGVFSSVYYIVNSFIFLSYENTIVKTNKREELPSLITLCLIICTLISVVTFIIFKLGKLLGWMFFIEFPSELLLFLTLLSTSYYTIVYSFANRERCFSSMSVANIINGAGQASIRILLGIIPIVAHGLIWGNALAHILSFLFIFICLINRIKALDWARVKISEIKKVFEKNIKFLKFDAPARFIEFLVGNLSIIILANFFSGNEIGCFSMSIQLVLLPITMIGSAMGNVYYSEISENCDDSNAVKKSTVRVSKICFYMSLIPILLISLGLDKFMPILLGEKWADAGKILLCLAIYSLPVILTEPLLPAFRALNCQEKRFYYNIFNVIFALGGLLLACMFFYNLYICLIIYSIAFAMVRFVMFNHILRITGVRLGEINIFLKISILAVYCVLVLRMIFTFFL